MKNMRKLLALATVALLAIGLGIAVVGCSQQPAEEESSMPAADNAMSPDSSMMMDSTMADSSMSH